MSGKIGRLVRSLVEAQEELHHQQKLQEEEVEVEEVVVEPAWDLLAVLRGAVALAEDDTSETTVDTSGELTFFLVEGEGVAKCYTNTQGSTIKRCIV